MSHAVALQEAQSRVGEEQVALKHPHWGYYGKVNFWKKSTKLEPV